MEGKRNFITIIVIGFIAGTLGFVFVNLIVGSKNEKDLGDRSVTNYGRALNHSKNTHDNNMMSASLSRINASRINELENKYSSISQNADNQTEQEKTVNSDEDPLKMTPERQEKLEEELRLEWERNIEAINQEPVDQQWAHEAEGLLENGLYSMGSVVNFEPVDITCYSTGCLSRVKFSNYKDAKENIARIIQEKYDVNCESGYNIPPPERPDEQYETTIMFRNCVKSK